MRDFVAEIRAQRDHYKKQLAILEQEVSLLDTDKSIIGFTKLQEEFNKNNKEYEEQISNAYREANS